MSAWFGDVSDSDEEVEESVSEGSSSDDESLTGFEKWRKRSDDEASEGDDDDDAGGGIKSVKQKLVEKIEGVKDELDFIIDDSFVQSEIKFTQLVNLAEDYVKKFKSNAHPYLQAIEMLAETLTKKAEAMKAEGAPEDDDDDEAAKDPAVAKRKAEEKHELKMFQLLKKRVLAKREELASEIDRMNKAAAAGDGEDGSSDSGDEEEAWTEAKMIERLVDLPSTRRRAPVCTKIAKMAKRAGLLAVQVSASGALASAVLDEDPDPNFVALRTWRRS